MRVRKRSNRPEVVARVVANLQRPESHLKDGRRAWPKALKDTGLGYFWLYDLRHTFASRLTQAGVSPLFVSQILGHSVLGLDIQMASKDKSVFSPNLLQTYVKANDEFRRSAISKLESYLEEQCAQLKTQHPQVIQ
jgi:hypothetical protein